jgi:hypothetical protein
MAMSIGRSGESGNMRVIDQLSVKEATYCIIYLGVV